MFTVREYHDMLLIYGKTRGNSIQAARLYGERFPNKRQPNPRTFVNTSQRLLDTGSVVRCTTCGIDFEFSYATFGAVSHFSTGKHFCFHFKHFNC